jgi:signal transduction histidine kinase
LAESIAVFLEQHRDLLITMWIEKVRRTLPTNATLTHDQLLDTLHLFLDELIDGLQSRHGRLADERQSPIAREHGRQRQVLERDMAELVREYGLLLESIAEIVEQTGADLRPQDVFDLGRHLFSGAAEAAAMYAERQADHQRRADYRYFAFVAHELRNPLSSARIAWDIMSRNCSLDPRVAGTLDRSLRRLGDLIDDSISRSRLTASGRVGELLPEQVALDQLVADIVAESAVDADAKHIRVEVETPPLVVSADRGLLRSALSNLLRNAIKFSREEGVVIVRGREDDGRVLLDVEDECGGLVPERAERLFDAFSQLTRDRRGFGLGLAISKQAVEAHRGTINVRNRPGKGCVFTIDLPRTQPGDLTD